MAKKGLQHLTKLEDGSNCSDIKYHCYSAEEVDRRLPFHYKHIAETGNFSTTVLKMSDNDVVAIALHCQHEIVIPLIVNRQAAQ